MPFVQVIDYETTDPQAVVRAAEEWKQATEGKRTARRLLLGKYRGDENRFCEIVFFDSYEDAMRNSAMPETQEYARRLSDLVEGDPQYSNLEVVDEMKL